MNKLFKSPKVAIYFLGVAIIVSLALFFVGFYAQKAVSKKSVLSKPHITFPPSNNYVPDQLIVNFREGFIPEDLATLEKEELENKKTPIGNLKNSYYSFERRILNNKKPDDLLSQINNELQQIGVVSYEKIYSTEDKSLKGFYILYLEEGNNIFEVQSRISALPYLYSSEANEIATINAIPDDPSFSQLWGMQKIQAPLAWDYTTGSSQVLVAVVDTGGDFNHPDLATSLVPGYNFANNTSSAQDDLGHGTHVSGTIGAIGNNTLGVVGVNWNVKIMPVKVCISTATHPYNACPTNATTQGVVYAADQGAKIINMSLGGRASCLTGSAYQSAISYATSKGALVVVAAGNDNSNAGGYSPAGCQDTLTVGASTQSDARASFSNFGDAVDIAAPGTTILSTWPSTPVSSRTQCKNPAGALDYCTTQGTSMASPMAAGAAALLLSANPSLTPSQIRDCLVQNGDPVTTDRPIGGVRLNIFKAMQACSNATPPNGVGTPTITITPGGPTLTPTLPFGGTVTPTLADFPTSTPIVTPTPNGGRLVAPGTPTPTPDQQFSCAPDPKCANSGKSIQLCPLICTPVP